MSDKNIGQGHGVEGRFGGLPDPFGQEEFAKVVILPIPFDKTSTYQTGSDKGPAALIEASRNMELFDIETSSEVYLKGVYTASPVIAETSEEMIKLAHQRTLDYLKNGKFVVSLGGEHTVSYGPIKAFLEHFGSLTVLQFDAHADLQPAYEENPWSHASVMARVSELTPQVKIVSVGIRSMSREEHPFINEKYTFYAHEISDNSDWLENLLNTLEGPVYLTFDLDAFDSSLMPSTGTPEPGGLMWNETMKILKNVFYLKNIVGFDVVELLPKAGHPAPDYLAAKLIYKLLSYKFHPKD